MSETILMGHVIFGVLGILASVWFFADVLNASDGNRNRMKSVSIAVAVFMFLSYVLGGYWYVTLYGADKAIILKSKQPWAHSYFMEVKEHVFFILLLLSAFLPIVAHRVWLQNDKNARNLAATTAGVIVFLGLVMEAFGAVIGYGVKIGLLGS